MSVLSQKHEYLRGGGAAEGDSVRGMTAISFVAQQSRRMNFKKTADVVVIASYGDSLVTFRGDLLRQMRARHQKVLALAPELSERTRRWLQAEGIAFAEAPLSRTGTDVWADLRYLFWLVRQIQEAKPSVVLAYTVKPVVYGMLAARLRRTRRYALITGLGYAFTEGAGSRAGLRVLVESLYRVALRQTDVVFFQNPDDEALFRERGLLASRTPSQVLAGSGIDVQAFQVAPLPKGPVSFLLIARLLGDKGVREFVAAVEQLRKRHPEVKARLVGWIDTNPGAIAQSELDAWIAKGTIEFLGKLDDVRSAIADCTVYVLPSYREGTPRTVLEAMAMGRPIVTTDAPGCRETVIDGDNGLLVPVRAVPELAAAMERFITEPGLAELMGRRARALAECKYDVRKVSATMLDTMGVGRQP